MAAITITAEGFGKALREMERTLVRTRAGLDAGLKAAGAFVKEESEKRVPVDTGVLRASHYVGGITGSKANRQIEVGASANYAIYVHEDLQARHTTGQAKFLERAYFDNQQKVTNIITNAARRG